MFSQWSAAERWLIAAAALFGVLALACAHLAFWASSWPHGDGSTWSNVLQFDAWLCVVGAFVCVVCAMDQARQRMLRDDPEATTRMRALP